MKNSSWSFNTKFLHLGLVMTISLNLLISLVMSEPDDNGGMIGRLAFELHEVLGLSAMLIVILHWIWSLTNQVDGGLTHLFPWKGEALNKVFSDVKNLFQGKMPEEGSKGGLAGLIHGLGLLAVTGITLTGTAFWILYPGIGEPGLLADGFAELHEGFAGLVWTYWLAHGGIAFLHHASGHNTLKNMFSLINKSKNNTTLDGLNNKSTHHI